MNLLTCKKEKLTSLQLKIKTYSHLYIFVFLNSLNLTGLFSFTFLRSALEFKSKLLFTCIFPEKSFRNFKCLTMKQIYNHYFIVCVFIDLIENGNKGLGHGYSIEYCIILVFWDQNAVTQPQIKLSVSLHETVSTPFTVFASVLSPLCFDISLIRKIVNVSL